MWIYFGNEQMSQLDVKLSLLYHKFTMQISQLEKYDVIECYLVNRKNGMEAIEMYLT